MTTPLGSSDPERIGPYTLCARIDSGGQGMVYLGRAPDGTPAAVKVLTPSWGDDTRQRARFAQELSAARRVAPFCTAAVLDADMDGPLPYIASEYVPGPTLRTAVREGGPREGPALDRLAIATVTALTAVHEAGVVHRDVKPGNVILGPDGPRLIDFGIARLDDATRHTTGVVGTPAYMSPEQVRGQAVGPASDVFSWASVMAFAATGRNAFPGETTMEVVDRVLRDEPDLDGVPDRLLPVLGRCLDKDPEARPRAVDVLSTLLGTGPTTAPLAATAVLEQAATLVDEGTAVIRPVLPPTDVLTGVAWAATAADAAGHGVPGAATEPEGATTRDRSAAGAVGAAPEPPGGGTAHGTSPFAGPAGSGAVGREPDPTVGARPGTKAPVPWHGRRVLGGRRRRHGARTGVLTRAAATVVLALLGVLLLVAYGRGALPEIVPIGSTPSTAPSEAPATGEQAPAGEVNQIEDPVGEPVEEPVAETADEGAGEPAEGADCAIDPHASGCPGEEPCGTDGCPGDGDEPGDGATDGGDGAGDEPSGEPGDGTDPEEPEDPEEPGVGGGVEPTVAPLDEPVFEPVWPVPGG
ncbi:serine/threonine-protein kinase [Nocardiopsis sp. CNR-923]|uniref:serine/threonine-protein kinase n=1 Tax=Nocardiopsis sp. CNR-923 TaxID=1904965 RepID=UPI00096A40B1|nr:serine/threonine-protein kinase [Nocardiopsis sp. CNR-923]